MQKTFSLHLVLYATFRRLSGPPAVSATANPRAPEPDFALGPAQSRLYNSLLLDYDDEEGSLARIPCRSKASGTGGKHIMKKRSMRDLFFPFLVMVVTFAPACTSYDPPP
ncbi:MAG: hypothetical protein D6812_18095, partial [Deltaproteobacteria bacterium]